MGTRSMIIVTLKETKKVAQYGQWDGYPSGVGLEVLKFIKENNIKTFKDKISNLDVLTDSEKENKEEFPDKENFPEYHRDTAAGILDLIMADKIWKRKMLIDLEGLNHAAWVYTIDLDLNILLVESYEQSVNFSLDNLPTSEEFLKSFE